MSDNTEVSVLEFLKKETLEGRIESTAREIAIGTNLVYNHVGRALERLIMRGQVAHRDRGTERKLVLYYYLKDVLDLCRAKWKG